MTRRWRIRLTILLVLVGIPAVLGCLFVYFTTTGRAGSWLAAEYALHMPGHLRIGGLVFTAADRVKLTDVAIAEGFAKPLFTAREIEARIDLFNRKLLAIDMKGAHMRLDADSYDFLQRIIEASAKMPPANPPPQWTLTASGTAEFASGVQLKDIHVEGPIRGNRFELTCSGQVNDETAPDRRLLVHVAGRDRGPVTSVENRRISIELKQVDASVPLALESLACIGLLPPAAPGLVARLPQRVRADGSVIYRDDGIVRFQVPARLTWKDPDGRTGIATANIDADVYRIGLSAIAITDSAFGAYQGGSAVIDLKQHTITASATSCVPGPGWAIPPAVPTQALLRQLPTLTVSYGIDDRSTKIALSHPERKASTLAIAWTADSPVRIDATQIPLTLAQGLMPADVSIGGGQATALSLAFDAEAGFSQVNLRDLRLSLAQGRATWNGWSVGPADGMLAITPQDDHSLKLTASIAGTTLVAKGDGTSGSATINLPAIDAALARLHGPVRLPSASGSAGIDVTWKQGSDGTLDLTLPRVELSNLDLRFDDRSEASRLPSLMQGLDTTLRGDLRWTPAGTAPAHLTVRTGGQLARGRLRLPTGTWLDLAARTPIFTADLDLRPGTGSTPALVQIRELLVRAAQPGGTPLNDGYSAQFGGMIDETGAGSCAGLVDHVNLGWVTEQAQLPPGALVGEGALIVNALFAEGGMEKLSGHFLPFNTDLALGPRFRASGITGDVAFTLDRATPAVPTAPSP